MELLASDIYLWNKFREGDTRAFARIYGLYISELLSYGYRITSNRQLIKDSIHDLFLHIWLHRDNLSETDSIKYYLFRSLRNRIVQNLQIPAGTVLADADFKIDGFIEDNSWEQEIIRQETSIGQLVRLRQAIESLPKRQQEAIQLRYFHAFDLEEIASVMQLTNQSVRNLLHRAISQLRGHFEVVTILTYSLIKILL